MRLCWATLCLAARSTDRTYDVTGLSIDTFWVVDVPSTIHFCVLLHLKGTEHEYDDATESLIEIAVTRGDQLIQDLSIVHTAFDVPVEHEAGWEVNEIMALPSVLTVDHLGPYHVDISFAGSRYRDPLYFIVRRGLPHVSYG